MAITTADRFFGEGVSTYGEGDPRTAFAEHRRFLRVKRLGDALGSDAKLDCITISGKFDAISLAITKADDQAFTDNAEFCALHGITRA